MASTRTSAHSLMEDIEDSPAPTKKSKKIGGGGGADKRVWIAIGGFVVSMVVLGYVVMNLVGSYRNNPARAAFFLTLMDAETQEVFEKVPIAKEARLPFTNPKTGKKNLYPVEACFWTKDGKAKLKPTVVILNESMGKPGPTRCPDCGRVVKHANPMPPDALMQAAWDEEQKKK